MSSFLSIAGRCSVAVGIVCAMGMGYVALSPEQAPSQLEVTPNLSTLPVSEAHADVTMMSFLDFSPTQKFVKTLEQLGHEPPRVYDMNGNEVFFSTRVTTKSPQELLLEYQHEFVNQRVNTSLHTYPIDQMMMPSEKDNTEEVSDTVNAAMNGEIIPHSVSKDYLSMGGAIMRLPREDHDGDALKTWAFYAKQLSNQYDQTHRAYTQCQGDPELITIALKNYQTTPDDEAVRTMQAAVKDGKCSQSATKTMCVQEKMEYDEAHNKVMAIKDAIDAQPALDNCSAMTASLRGTMQSALDDAKERIKAVRYIEANRDEETGLTNVTATWTNSSFKPKNMMTEKYGYPKDRKPRGETDICPGCTRSWNFGGNGTEHALVTDMITSPQPIGAVSAHYVRDMVNKGWTLDPASKKVQQLYEADGVRKGTQHLRFVRGTEHTAIMLSHDGRTNHTNITSTRSD